MSSLVPRGKRSCGGSFRLSQMMPCARIGVSNALSSVSPFRRFAVSPTRRFAHSPFRPLALPPWTIHPTQATVPRLVNDLPSHGPDNVALRQQFFDFLLEHAVDQIYFKDTAGRFTCASRAVAEFMGVASPAELIGKSDFDFWSEQTASEAAADEKRGMEKGQPLIGKVERLVYPSGRG